MVEIYILYEKKGFSILDPKQREICIFWKKTKSFDVKNLLKRFGHKFKTYSSTF